MSGTVYCYRCDARYTHNLDWVYVRRDRHSTSTRKTILGPVLLQPGDCPMCQRPPQLQPGPIAGAM